MLSIIISEILGGKMECLGRKLPPCPPPPPPPPPLDRTLVCVCVEGGGYMYGQVLSDMSATWYVVTQLSPPPHVTLKEFLGNFHYCQVVHLTAIYYRALNE